ncbi:hypothetical protein KAFR_0K00520 [Kazachstania africana CBS 2517]|uniref:BHLH domain-containing protein n=1 Tax=Kazachstania africana (strain ATCC 22294 / BCRC 22015 / CBS 2517 / CECT 1963 / NBRC 1671 / NRRL Y-8276) TaxID=1071382 RepID=H2B1A7_KAZAF|nr:hypothetical protein KAFR_0K00520 [Kazachstania africana CBS 2517]CCF60407.1 hypothetical protein KAFR_0K00520 [Kazachstania africana CBS 2517]
MVNNIEYVHAFHQSENEMFQQSLNDNINNDLSHDVYFSTRNADDMKPFLLHQNVNNFITTSNDRLMNKTPTISESPSFSSSSSSWFEPLETIISSNSSSFTGSPLDDVSFVASNDNVHTNNNSAAAAATSVIIPDATMFQTMSQDYRQPEIKREEVSHDRKFIKTTINKRAKKETLETVKTCQRKRLTPKQKQAHNKIEKRYRININTKIAKLQQIIPWVASEQTAFEVSDAIKREQQNKATATRLNKSMILEKAVDYILYLQNNKNLYEMEVERLRNELDLLKKKYE